jgi:hypothetical protein
MKTTLLLTLTTLFVSAGAAMAHDMKGMKEPSKEDRAKMADMHMKMAECLKSDKSMKECHEAMEKSCKDSKMPMCHMMGHHGEHGHDGGEGEGK